MADPASILGILQFVGAAAMAVCSAIDKAVALEQEERQALKDLRKGVEDLRSDTMVYKVLLNAMEDDKDANGRSPYTHFIKRYVGFAVNFICSHYGITDRMERKQ